MDEFEAKDCNVWRDMDNKKPWEVIILLLNILYHA